MQEKYFLYPSTVTKVPPFTVVPMQLLKPLNVQTASKALSHDASQAALRPRFLQWRRGFLRMGEGCPLTFSRNFLH